MGVWMPMVKLAQTGKFRGQEFKKSKKDLDSWLLYVVHIPCDLGGWLGIYWYSVSRKNNKVCSSYSFVFCWWHLGNCVFHDALQTTNILPLNINGWKMNFLFGGHKAYFQGAELAVSFTLNIRDRRWLVLVLLIRCYVPSLGAGPSISIWEVGNLVDFFDMLGWKKLDQCGEYKN